MANTVALKKGTPSVRDLVSAEEWQVRVDLAACYRLVAMYGWTDMIFTHLSARVPNTDHNFLINPYGMLFDEITASSLVKVDLEGRIIMESEYAINPAGFTIHSAVHAARDDAHCVMHLHTDQGVAVSAQKHGLLPLSQTAMAVIEDVAYHDFEGIALNLDERERLVNDIGKKNLMILRNHGTLTVGESVKDAFLRMFFLERACSMQIQALSAGLDNVHWATDDARETTARQGKGITAVAGLAWDGLLRKLDRMDPSFRD